MKNVWKVVSAHADCHGNYQYWSALVGEPHTKTPAAWGTNFRVKYPLGQLVERPPGTIGLCCFRTLAAARQWIYCYLRREAYGPARHAILRCETKAPRRTATWLLMLKDIDGWAAKRKHWTSPQGAGYPRVTAWFNTNKEWLIVSSLMPVEVAIEPMNTVTPSMPIVNRRAQI